MGGARRVGSAMASVWVEFVEAVSGGGHVVVHPVQKAIIRVSRCCHTGRGGGGHHRPAPLLPEVEAAPMATIARVFGAVVMLRCRLCRIAGQRG